MKGMGKKRPPPAEEDARFKDLLSHIASAALARRALLSV
jgi:hypothetical protein